MKKDEVIELLKEQIKELRDDNNRLLDQIDDLIKEVSSLKEALLQKGESLSKQQRLTKGIAKLVSNTSEQPPPQPALPYEYGSYVYYETGSPAFWRRHCQLSVSGKIPDVTCPVPAVGTCRNSCRTCHYPGQVVVPASGCRFHTSSSFFQRRDRKRKGRKSPALPSRYGRDNYQILLLVLQFPCLWRSRFRQDQIHRQTLMEQYIRSGFAGFIYDFKDFDIPGLHTT